MKNVHLLLVALRKHFLTSLANAELVSALDVVIAELAAELEKEAAYLARRVEADNKPAPTAETPAAPSSSTPIA